MDFKTAILTCLNKYTTISGRAQRSEFWFFALFNLIGSVVANAMDAALIATLGFPIVSIIWLLALFLPGLCVSIRRMHDLDKSGWWILIALIPVIGILVYIYWLVSKGTDGPNRFGPDPLNEVRFATA
jgi:uncharacterized membrane protein YhaH (DUF805 family)